MLAGSSIVARTIRSTSQGGNWHSPSTWVGGVVPGGGDDVILEGKVFLDSEVGIRDTCLSLTITQGGILQAAAQTLSQLAVGEAFINFGRVVKEENENFLLHLYGHVMNYGKMENPFVFAFIGDSVSKITGTFDCPIVFKAVTDTAGSHILVVGKTLFNGLITLQGKVVIDYNADMTISEASWDGIINADNLLVNNGVYRQQTIRNFQNTYFDSGGYLRLTFKDFYGSANKPALVTYGSECHPRMRSSVCRWWRLSAGIPGDTLDPYTLELTYDDALLNGIRETELHVYLSKDEGITWAKISNTATLVRNTEDNVISIGSEEEPVTAGGGDIILAAGEEDISLPSSISVSIIGPDDIRMGAPNRYRIAYWNNGTVNTGTFFIKVRLGGGIEFDRMISHYPGDNTPVEFGVEKINPYGDPTYGFFLIDGLGSKEYSSFDVILNCYPDETKSAAVTGEAAVLPLIAVAALYIAGGLVVDYVSDVLVNSCYEIVFNDNTTVMDAAKNVYEGGIKKTNREYTVATPFESIGSAVSGDIVAIAGIALWPADLIKKFWDCIDDIAEGLNEANALKNPRKVKAWDPNAKYGPSGYGEENFMAQSSPMTYMIRFENMKEATAAAYRVVVTDRLDPEVFDISTVDTLGMSHSMGLFSIDDNTLTWDFTEIELPPNKVPPEGEGWVSFKVNLKEGLPSGTAIKNKAVIVFDFNPAMETNETVNTLDYDAPVSVPQDLPSLVEGPVVLEWNADDGTGSGVDLSYVYMSVNNGPYTLTGTVTGNMKSMEVVPGNDYRFFVLSKDHVGNTEAEPAKVVSARAVTALDDRVRNEGLTLYPNPAAGGFTVLVTGGSPGELEVAVTDLQGRKLRDIRGYVTSGGLSVPVDTGDLAPGLYLVVVKNGGMSRVGKIMVRH